jgi:hypothetical protein
VPGLRLTRYRICLRHGPVLLLQWQIDMEVEPAPDRLSTSIWPPWVLIAP